MMASVNRDSIQNGSDPMRLLSSVKPGVRRIAEGLYALSRTLAPCMWQGRGWDPSEGAASEHGSGRALDLMIAYQVGSRPSAGERLQGDRLAQWIIDHRVQLSLKWLIWSGRIYNPSRGGWRTYTGGTGTTAGHYDHIHAYFGSGSDWTLGKIDTDEEDEDYDMNITDKVTWVRKGGKQETDALGKFFWDMGYRLDALEKYLQMVPYVDPTGKETKVVYGVYTLQMSRRQTKLEKQVTELSQMMAAIAKKIGA